MEVDILIVGASLAGLAACLSASQEGLSTLLIEKRELLAVPRPAVSVMEGMLKRSGLDIPCEFIRHRVQGFRILSPGGEALSFDSPGLIIRRPEYDSFLAKSIEEQGGRILTGATVRALKFRDSRVEGVVFERKGRVQEVQAKIVIDASGADSNLPLPPGFSPLRSPGDLARGVQVEIEGAAADPNFFEFYLGEQVAPGWKAAVLPTGRNRAIFGVYPRGGAKAAEEYLENFLHIPRVQRMWEGGERGPILKGADAVAALPGRLVGHGLMVAGGRGGQAGIPYGMRGGILAAKTAAGAVKRGDCSARALCTYEHRWKRSFLKEYVWGKRALQALQRLDDPSLDRLFRVLQQCGFPQNYFSGGKLRVVKLFAGLARKDLRFLPALFGKILKRDGKGRPSFS